MSDGLTDWHDLSLGTAGPTGPDEDMQFAPCERDDDDVASHSVHQTLRIYPSASSDTTGLSAEEVDTINQLQGQFSNLHMRRLIDEGASSQVWEGDWAGARVVIKVLREQEALHSFLSEVNIWRQLRHPCVCSLLGVCIFEQRPSMVLEYMIGACMPQIVHIAAELHLQAGVDCAPRPLQVARCTIYFTTPQRDPAATAARILAPL